MNYDDLWSIDDDLSIFIDHLWWCVDEVWMIYWWFVDDIYIYNIDVHLSLSLHRNSPYSFGGLTIPSPHYQSLSFRDKQSLKYMQTTEHENNQHTYSSNFFYGERGPHGKGYSCSNCKTNWTGTSSKSTHFSSPPYPTCLGIRHLSLRHGHSPWKSTIDRSLLCLESLESWETNPPKNMGH